MADFFLGQVMMTGFGWAPKGWAQCNGQLLPIAQNQALFSLLGVTFGGNGTVNFALPDLRSRTPAGGVPSADAGWAPPQYVPGQIAGTEAVTLLQQQMPQHTHTVTATSAAAAELIGDTTLTFAATSAPFYGPAATVTPLDGGPLTPAGGTQPHPNLQPYETINFNIALVGVYPSRN